MFDLEQINECFTKIREVKALIIGDTIIDQYVFVVPKGRAIKDPILSVEYRGYESYAGGILAVANHIGDFIEKIKLITLIGDQNSKLEFIKESIRDNIELKVFIKENSPTIVKKRFIDPHRNSKLFKVEYMNDKPVSKDLTEEIVNYLDEELPKYDLVVVGDFGHGFINEAIRRKLEEKSRFLTLNVQSNSANMGYNYFNLYKKIGFISMDEQELRLPLLKRFEEIDDVIKESYNVFKNEKFLVTRGRRGSIFINKGNIFKAPILTESVVDTVGAGDSVFAIISLLAYSNADNELVPFIANCVGGIAVNFMGNKESITKEKLFNFIKGLYENEME